MSRATTIQYRFLSAALAFLLWGAWAFYINGDYDFTTRTTSALTQGSASFIITLIMVSMVTLIYNALPDNALRLMLPAFITVLCTGSLLYLVHYLVGTPRIIHTIAPPLTVAFLFCIFTSFKL